MEATKIRRLLAGVFDPLFEKTKMQTKMTYGPIWKRPKLEDIWREISIQFLKKFFKNRIGLIADHEESNKHSIGVLGSLFSEGDDQAYTRELNLGLSV